MNKQIIPASLNDIEAVCRLFEQAITFIKQHKYIGWTVYDMSTIRTDIEKGQLYKIIRGNDMLGIFSVYTTDPLIWRDKEKGDAVYLHRIVLNQSFKGEKLVQDILSWTRNYANKFHRDFIRMDTWAANEKLISYYKSYGFRFVEHFTSGDTAELPLQHRNLDLVLLELNVQPDNTMIETLKTLFAKDLHRLHTEIESYRSEAAIWKTDKQIANSAGNLCLHLAGNLNTYIGREIGKTGYIRNRDAEFALKNVPREELLEKIRGTADVVKAALNNLQDGGLAKEYPLLVWETKTSVGHLLIQLVIHLGYHLGQVNYHRRLLDKE